MNSGFGNAEGQCDCGIEDVASSLRYYDPNNPVTTVGGTNYTTWACVNWAKSLAGGSTTYCNPQPPPACLKNVRVVVSWVIGHSTTTSNVSTMVYSY